MPLHLKKYLPVENYTLTSELSVEEIIRQLSENVEPKKNFRFSIFSKGSNKPYEGEVSANTFTISRIIDYRNSFLPVIRGRIIRIHGKTLINVKMQPAIFVIVFMSLWLGVIGFACLVIVVSGIVNMGKNLQNGFSPFTIIPFVMFLFGYLLTTFAFKAESKDSKRFLAALFEGQEQVD